ncbi:hypothetical protein LCGC14_1644190 [marine sediment metagenome]|uniref:Uncharacterized protein n=1 Tax=marine sediment metagenome TaxID=412755 RepID=A0A0F9KEN8_9ZZZZ
MNDVWIVGLIGASFLVGFLFLAVAMGKHLKSRNKKTDG